MKSKFFQQQAIIFILLLLIIPPLFAGSPKKVQKNSTLQKNGLRLSQKSSTKINKFLKQVQTAVSLTDVLRAYDKISLNEEEREILGNELKKNIYSRKIDSLKTKQLNALKANSILRSKATIRKIKEVAEQTQKKTLDDINRETLDKFNKLKSKGSADRLDNDIVSNPRPVRISSFEPLVLAPDQLFLIQGDPFLNERGIVSARIDSTDRFLSMEIEHWSNLYILGRFPSEIRPFLSDTANIRVINDNEIKSAPIQISVEPARTFEVLSHQISVKMNQSSYRILHELWDGLILDTGWKIISIGIDDIEVFPKSSIENSNLSILFEKSPDPGSSDPKTNVLTTALPEEWSFKTPMCSFFVHLTIEGPEGFDYH